MALIVGIIIGLVLGLTGAGGSVFAVPLLVLLLELPAQQAIGISLGAVAVSALFGVMNNLRGGQILWLPAVVFGVLGATFAPLGGWVGRTMPESLVLTMFTVLVLIIAIRMWRQAANHPDQTKVVRASLSVSKTDEGAICRANQNMPFKIGLPCVLSMSGAAITTGVLSGLFGVGGGFLIIPALLYLTSISMPQAVATSLVIISAISSSGSLSFFLDGNQVPLSVLGLTAVGGLIGMGAGSFASHKLSGPTLHKVFAIAMVLLAGFTLLKQFI